MSKKIMSSVSLAFIIPLIHFLLTALVPDIMQMTLSHLLLIYAILLALTILHLFVARLVARKFEQQASLIIVALNMLKMILSVVLLFLIVVPVTGKGGAVALNFMGAYIFYLVFDSQMVILLLTGGKGNTGNEGAVNTEKKD